VFNSPRAQKKDEREWVHFVVDIDKSNNTSKDRG
jgi:hypothetical protein